MPDLKDLLRPLDDDPMPDRWERIRRRTIEPIEEPRRPRRAVVVGTALASSLLVVTVIAALGPLRGGGSTAGETGTDQPPAWLVEAAYGEAYRSGDLIPDSAEWTLLPRSAIPTPVGPDGAGDPTEDYVIILHGHFNGYTLSAPAEASLPRGSVFSIAYDAITHEITDLSLGDLDVNLEGLQPFTLPGPDDTFASPQGWSIAIPPGWKTMPLADGWSEAAGPGAVISNHDPEMPVGQAGFPPQASSDGFPSNGLTLVVAKMKSIIPGVVYPKPPLSYDDFAKGSTGRGSTLDTIVFGGPDGEYTASIRTGPDVSPLDLAAIRDVVASLTFVGSPTSSATSAPTTPPTLSGTIALVGRDGSLLSPKVMVGRAMFLAPTRLALTTMGSGSCPNLPTDLEVADPHTLDPARSHLGSDAWVVHARLSNDRVRGRGRSDGSGRDA